MTRNAYSIHTFAGEMMFDQYKKKLEYSFLSNHALIYLLVTENPNISIKEISEALALSDRSIHGILFELNKSGFITTTKNGRYNSYSANLSIPVRKRPDGSIMTGKDLYDAWSGKYNSLTKAMIEHLQVD